MSRYMSIGEWGALVGGKVSRGPLANGLDHWAMALYWWVAHGHSPMTGLVGGLEQSHLNSFADSGFSFVTLNIIITGQSVKRVTVLYCLSQANQ
jgi:hypothetical protein